MRPVLIHKNKCLVVVLLLLNANTSSFELAAHPHDIVLQEMATPSILRINGRNSYCLDLAADQISLKPNTFFCIVQRVRTCPKPGNSKEIIRSYNYYVNNYNNTGIELYSEESRFETASAQGWQYYIFKTKERTGTFVISLAPFFKDLPPKFIKVIV